MAGGYALYGKWDSNCPDSTLIDAIDETDDIEGLHDACDYFAKQNNCGRYTVVDQVTGKYIGLLVKRGYSEDYTIVEVL